MAAFLAGAMVAVLGAIAAVPKPIVGPAAQQDNRACTHPFPKRQRHPV